MEGKEEAEDPSRFRLVYANIQAVCTYFSLFHSHAMQCKSARQKGAAEERVVRVFLGVSAAARRGLLTPRVLEERPGAAACVPAFPTG